MPGPNLEAMIATLRAERDQVVAQYDAAINALMKISQGQLTLDAAPSAGQMREPTPLRTPTLGRPYAGKTVADAAERHLRAVNRSMSAPAIARALLEGGWTTTSKKASPTAIVYNGMFLNKDRFRKDKVGRETLWSLKEWPEAKVVNF